MIKVIFRKDKKTGEVMAVFPSMAGDCFYFITCLCYSHVGQHSKTSFNYYYESTTPASETEYRDLLNELQSIYDNQLTVSSRITHADYANRKAQIENAH